MKNTLLLGAAALAIITMPVLAKAEDAAVTSRITTTESVATTSAPAAVPGLGEGVKVVPEDESQGIVTTTTTTTTKETTTTGTEESKPPVVPVATPESLTGSADVDTHGEKGADESTDAGDKAAKSTTPLEEPALPEGDSSAEGNAKVDEHIGVKTH